MSKNITDIVEEIESSIELNLIDSRLHEHIGKKYLKEYIGLCILEYEHKKQQQSYKLNKESEFNYYCPT